MATTVAWSLLSDRYANTAVFVASVTNSDGDVDILGSLPADVGDVLVLELCVFAFGGFATLATNFGSFGIFAGIVGEVDTVLRDIVGSIPGNGAWAPSAGTLAAPTAIVSAMLKPDSGVLWKSGERLRVLFPELDTNVAPTVDYQVFVKVQRLRVAPLPERGFELTS